MAWFRPNRCPRARIRGVYGDEINAVGGLRLRCLDCRRHLDGDLALATHRRARFGAQRGQFVPVERGEQ